MYFILFYFTSDNYLRVKRVVVQVLSEHTSQMYAQHHPLVRIVDAIVL